MYLYNVSEKNLSYPCISCPLISEQSFCQNPAPRNMTKNREALEYVDSKYSEIGFSGQNHRKKLLRNIFTKLRSPSSIELQALLSMSRESCRVISDKNYNFQHYWSQILHQTELRNKNATGPDVKHRNIACLCKPVNEISRGKEEVVEYDTVKNKGCLCIPRYVTDPSEKNIRKSFETEREKKWSKRNDEKISTSESDSSKEIRVCLPLDPDEFGGTSHGKGIKLVIYGDKKSYDCKCRNEGVAQKESSSYECLACTISKNPQFKNLLTDLANGDKNKQKKTRVPSRFPTKLSTTFPFFKKKHKNIQVLQCSDKCEQTCSEEYEKKVDKACSCTCCPKPELVKKIRSSHCDCVKCGKVDLQKFVTNCPTCKCGRDDALKLILKMEAKQNYRQIKHIFKEIKDQRNEIKDLHKRYTSLMKMQITRSSSGDGSERFKEYINDLRKLEYGFRSMDHHEENNIKQLKDAINQSTVNKLNEPEKLDAVTDTNETDEKHIAKFSELSLFAVNNGILENEVKYEKPVAVESVSEKSDVPNNKEDSCICLKQKYTKCGNFWRNLFGKEKPCPKKCDCKNKILIGKCKNILEKKVKVRTKKSKKLK
ncbi:uncharacterized protein isoform X2 [Leptinotarsa decemlineata]|uniref:uncharacterized protein isoform X2 n=1 Tax=Leptinotarsa decemlineata TaxID=7539 RepID=UPI003D3083DF